MSLKTTAVILSFLLLLVITAPFSAAASYYTTDTTISAGSESVEYFSLDAGSTFGWEVLVHSTSGVEVWLLDAENYQKRSDGQPFTSIHGPISIGSQSSDGYYHTAEQADTFYLIVKATGPGTAEVSITLIDVPFFSTSFGKIFLMVLQGIGVLILLIFIVVATVVLRGRLKAKRDNDRSFSDPGNSYSDYNLEGSNRIQDRNNRDRDYRRNASNDDYKAIDPFQDDPYKVSKPIWKRK